MSAYARQGYHYNRNHHSKSSTTRDAESGSLVSGSGGDGGTGRDANVKNGQRNRNNRDHADGIQRFSRQKRIALSQNDEQGGQEIMVDNAGGEFSLSQETEITLTQALLEPDKKQMQRSQSGNPGTTHNDERSSFNRHLAGRKPHAMGGRGGMNTGRGVKHHNAMTPSHQKRRQIQQTNIQLSQKKNRRLNPTQTQRTAVTNKYRNFSTPAANAGNHISSSKSVSCRSNGLFLSQKSMHDEEDDNSTIQNRTLFTQDSHVGGHSLVGGQQQQQQRQRFSTQRSTVRTPHNNGQQQQQQRPNMNMTSNTVHQRIPSLTSTRRPTSTAIRTLGGISNTLATVTTPVKNSLRTMKSYAMKTAARTGATLGLTPSHFRPSLTTGLTGGTFRPGLTKSVVGTNRILMKRPMVEEVDDDASKVTQKTYDPAEAEEKDGSGGGGGGTSSLASRQEAALNEEKEKLDGFLSKVQTAMDEKIKQFDDKLNAKLTQKEQELRQYFERASKTFDEKISKEFAEKKQELNDMFERTTNTLKESATRIEEIQLAMDTFPTKITSSMTQQEDHIRELVEQTKEEITRESTRVIESITSKARAVSENEAKKCMGEVVNSIDAAKGDFQIWMNGVLAGMKSSIIGYDQPLPTTLGEEVTNVTVETHDFETEESQTTTEANHDKENEHPVVVDRSSQSEGANAKAMAMDTECSNNEVRNCDDIQSAKWNDDNDDEGGDDAAEEQVKDSKTSATLFPSKATPSTAATPFSRKKTPIKNNYGKNRKSTLPTRKAHEDELDTEEQHQVQNDTDNAISPCKYASSTNTKRADKRSPSSPQIPLNLSSDKKKRRRYPLSPHLDNRVVKSTKESAKRESKHRVKTKSPPVQKSQSRDVESKQTDKSNQKISDEAGVMKAKVSTNNDTNLQLSQRSEKKTNRSEKSENAPQQSQPSEKKETERAPQPSRRPAKKRDQSALAVEKSTRRSKRLKESSRKEKATIELKTRTEQAVQRTKKKKAKASKAKQVTPLDRQPKQKSNEEKVDLDDQLHVYPTNDDSEDLIGKDIVVECKDDSSGLDSDDVDNENPKVTLPTLFRRNRKKKYGRKKKSSITVSKAEKADSVWSLKW